MWKENWKQFIEDLNSIPSKVDSNNIAEPISSDKTTEIEEKFGIKLPPKFKDFLMNSAGGIDVWWDFEDGARVKLEGETEPISGGYFILSIDEILEMNFRLEDDYGPDEDDLEIHPRNLLAFAGVENGDQFAVVHSGDEIDSIKYISFDSEEIHLYTVGDDIFSFLSHYARLGFAGCEFWIWEQFTNQHTTPIDSESPKAIEFLYAIRGGIISAEALVAKDRPDQKIDIISEMDEIFFPDQQKDMDGKVEKIPCTTPGIFDHEILGRLKFDSLFNGWETKTSPIYILGIPGDKEGINKESFDLIIDKVIHIEKYIKLCSEDLLDIVDQYDSFPKNLSVKELFKEPSLGLEDSYWTMSFLARDEYEWINITMRFEGEIVISMEVDDGKKVYEKEKSGGEWGPIEIID
jgi:hypothetical protein